MDVFLLYLFSCVTFTFFTFSVVFLRALNRFIKA